MEAEGVLERIALAFHEELRASWPHAPAWYGMTQTYRDQHVAAMRAALAALVPASEEMIDAADEAYLDERARGKVECEAKYGKKGGYSSWQCAQAAFTAAIESLTKAPTP